MARATAITNTLVMGPNVSAEVTANAVTANTALYVDSNQLDERTIFEFTASAAANLTIKAGTGYAGVNDLTFEVAKDKTVAFTLDSARFAKASGENAGLIEIVSDAAGTLKVIQAKV